MNATVLLKNGARLTCLNVTKVKKIKRLGKELIVIYFKNKGLHLNGNSVFEINEVANVILKNEDNLGCKIE